MTELRPVPTGWWGTAFFLLRAARVRARGRRRRQRELTGRAAGRTRRRGVLGDVISLAVALLMSASAAYVVGGVVRVGQQVAAEQRGLLPVDHWFIARVGEAQAAGQAAGTWPGGAEAALRDALDQETTELAGFDAARRAATRQALLAAAQGGGAAFVPRGEAVPGLAASAPAGLPAVLGSLALLLWFTGLVFAGEGLELDVGRRRHPMWEWLFSHPVRPSAVFAAEMLAPVAANPAYWTAPLVPGVLYAGTYGFWPGVLAAVLVGVPVTLAAAFFGKALEVAVTLRTAVRSRGALIGLMTWLGTAASAFPVVLAFTLDGTARSIAYAVGPLAGLPWPWLGWFLGLRDEGEPSFLLGVAFCVAASAAVMAAAVASSAWSTARGLAGKVGPRDAAPARQARFNGRNALFRKELAWFTRDRSALVQVILVPATLAGFQVFNLHRLMTEVETGWHILCGIGILLGTYFLAILGPKSLASEGGTLWLAMTWPHGMESLLRAKARLWAGLASIPAGLAMAYAAWLFPADRWNVALVALGWAVFAQSMAVKAVTLAQVTSESGETEKVPAGRRWAVQLGTFAFAGSVLTRQAGPAIAGIVFSVATAVAMWQNFRARLPFLLDPWSERLPKPPTSMHAMVAISAMIEVGAVLNGTVAAVGGQDAARVGFAVSYGVAAMGVSVCTAVFLLRRGVAWSDVWTWPAGDPALPSGRRSVRAWVPSLLAGIGAGLALGLLGCGYLAALEHLPWTAKALGQARAAAAGHVVQVSFLVAAVLFAPVAEEFLFRGLLFRALARDWTGWHAVGGSAVFFASYHPMMSWLPVCTLGVACAVLFKRTGRLAATVVLHATYNAVVLGWQMLG